MSEDEFDERRRLLHALALLDGADNVIHQLGHEQAMSVGPVISDLNDLRGKLVQLGQGYGVLDDDETEGELLHEVRSNYDARVVTPEDEHDD